MVLVVHQVAVVDVLVVLPAVVQLVTMAVLQDVKEIVNHHVIQHAVLIVGADVQVPTHQLLL